MSPYLLYDGPAKVSVGSGRVELAEEAIMDHHVYKLTEIVGISKEGMDAAIRVALDRARQTIRNVRWFEVVGSRGYVNPEGEIDYQVTLKVGFVLED